MPSGVKAILSTRSAWPTKRRASPLPRSTRSWTYRSADLPDPAGILRLFAALTSTTAPQEHVPSALVPRGKTRTAVFVLSDFDDNFPNPEKSEKRVADSLKAFAKTNGVVGFYFLEHPRVPLWRDHLRKSGIKQWVCESEIVAYPFNTSTFYSCGTQSHTNRSEVKVLVVGISRNPSDDVPDR